MTKRNQPTTNDAGRSSPNPSEAHQRAGVGQIKELIRFVMGRPFSKPCVMFGEVAGQFVKF